MFLPWQFRDVFGGVLLLTEVFRARSTQNNLQSTMPDYQSLGLCLSPRRGTIPRYSHIPPQTSSLCLVIPHLQNSTLPTRQFGLLMGTLLIGSHKAVNSQETYVARDLAIRSRMLFKITNSYRKFPIARIVRLLNKRPNIPHISYWYIK